MLRSRCLHAQGAMVCCSIIYTSGQTWPSWRRASNTMTRSYKHDPPERRASSPNRRSRGTHTLKAASPTFVPTRSE